MEYKGRRSNGNMLTIHDFMTEIIQLGLDFSFGTKTKL